MEVRLVGGNMTPGLLLPALSRRLASKLDFWRARPEHPRCREFLDWTARELAHIETHAGTFRAGLAR